MKRKKIIIGMMFGAAVWTAGMTALAEETSEETEAALSEDSNTSTSFSIIGGADGPTSIFLAGKIGQKSRIAELWGVQENLSDYTEIIGQTQEKDGYIVTLDEVLISDNQIYAAVTANIDDPQEVLESTDFITVNGRECNLKSISEQADGYESETSLQHRLYVLTLRDSGKLEQVTDMEMHFLLYKKTENVEKRENAALFDFSFEASREELERKTVRTGLNESIELDDGAKMELKNLVITPVDSRIEGKIYGADSLGYYDYCLKGTDSLGNSVSYSFSSFEGNQGEVGEIVFTSDLKYGKLPSADGEWVKLEVYNKEEMQDDVYIEYSHDKDVL
ncbi:MAG: hypothetical protein Q4F83_01550 [Eubacteriales bacterium]|nr:hypothetical protein [Eubacteriales bacterium]